MLVDNDILEQLQKDPGNLTLGQLIQERERAAQEIRHLRYEIQHILDYQLKKHCASTENSKSVAKPQALIRLRDVCNIVGLSRSTIYLRLSHGQFPQPIRIGTRAVRWCIEDIENWKAEFRR